MFCPFPNEDIRNQQRWGPLHLSANQYRTVGLATHEIGGGPHGHDMMTISNCLLPVCLQ